MVYAALVRLQTLVWSVALVLGCRATNDRTTPPTHPIVAHTSGVSETVAAPTGELPCLAPEQFPQSVTAGRFEAGNQNVRLLASGKAEVTFSDGGPAEPSGTFEGTWSRKPGEIRYSFVYENPDPGACQYGCGEEAYNDGKPDPERRADECAKACRAGARSRYGSETPTETIACFVRPSSSGLVTNCAGGSKSGQTFTSVDDAAITCAGITGRAAR
jgi:hypothetical protein